MQSNRLALSSSSCSVAGAVSTRLRPRKSQKNLTYRDTESEGDECLLGSGEDEEPDNSRNTPREPKTIKCLLVNKIERFLARRIKPAVQSSEPDPASAGSQVTESQARCGSESSSSRLRDDAPTRSPGQDDEGRSSAMSGGGDASETKYIDSHSELPDSRSGPPVQGEKEARNEQRPHSDSVSGISVAETEKTGAEKGNCTGPRTGAKEASKTGYKKASGDEKGVGNAESASEEQPGGAEPAEYEYLVKYQNLSYLHCEWLGSTEVNAAILDDRALKMRFKNFIKKIESGQEVPELELVNVVPEKIIDSSDQFRALYPMKAAEISRNEWIMYCLKIVDSVVCFERHHRKYVIPFLRPVDEGRDGAPDYYNVVKNPMDFSTVQTKLYLRRYNSPQEFWTDVKSIFRNCLQYNSPDTDISVQCRVLELLFDKLYEEWSQICHSTQDSSKRMGTDSSPENKQLKPTRELTEEEELIKGESFRKILENPNRKTLYLVKWKNRSYTEVSWELLTDISDQKKIAQYLRHVRAPEHLRDMRRYESWEVDLQQQMLRETLLYIKAAKEYLHGNMTVPVDSLPPLTSASSFSRDHRGSNYRSHPLSQAPRHHRYSSVGSVKEAPLSYSSHSGDSEHKLRAKRSSLMVSSFSNSSQGSSNNPSFGSPPVSEMLIALESKNRSKFIEQKLNPSRVMEPDSPYYSGSREYPIMAPGRMIPGCSRYMGFRGRNLTDENLFPVGPSLLAPIRPSKYVPLGENHHKHHNTFLPSGLGPAGSRPVYNMSSGCPMVQLRVFDGHQSSLMQVPARPRAPVGFLPGRNFNATLELKNNKSDIINQARGGWPGLVDSGTAINDPSAEHRAGVAVLEGRSLSNCEGACCLFDLRAETDFSLTCEKSWDPNFVSEEFLHGQLKSCNALLPCINLSEYSPPESEHKKSNLGQSFGFALGIGPGSCNLAGVPAEVDLLCEGGQLGGGRASSEGPVFQEVACPDSCQAFSDVNVMDGCHETQSTTGQEDYLERPLLLPSGARESCVRFGAASPGTGRAPDGGEGKTDPQGEQPDEERTHALDGTAVGTRGSVTEPRDMELANQETEPGISATAEMPQLQMTSLQASRLQTPVVQAAAAPPVSESSKIDRTKPASFAARSLYADNFTQMKRPRSPPAGVSRHYSLGASYKGNRKLFDYQLDGLNWLLQLWSSGNNGILADEMGLGKTVQTIVFLLHLFLKEKIKGPFLVVAPLSTLDHWRKTAEDWTDFNTVVYHDESGRAGRDALREAEWYHRVVDLGRRMTTPSGVEVYTNPRIVGTREYKFHLLLTSYEIFASDADILVAIPWQYVVVDEAHRLKNRLSKTLNLLRQVSCRYTLLLTGTPVQNNTEELWPLLNYIEPVKFCDLDAFKAEFGELQSNEQVTRLTELLRPHLLRRVKEDVAHSIPPLEETIIDVELTILQKAYYKAIFEKNKNFLFKNAKKGQPLPSLLNVEMELRKCCNHPFMIQGVEQREYATCKTTEEQFKKLVENSGKLVLLDKLLPKLKAENRKVLIFSQFQQTLTIIQDFLSYRGWVYERIDGNIKGSERTAAIDRFNDPKCDRFVFLLSTRAGGLGINLTSADTVIIYDSDWNPQNDVQATARAHRIGQEREVKVYRLITSRTYEGDMFDRASKKLGLNTAVFHRGAFDSKSRTTDPCSKKDEHGNATNFSASSKLPSKEEIEELLKKGAFYLLENTSDASRQFQENNIEEILSKNSRLVRYQLTGMSSTFAKTSFKSEKASDLSLDDPDFWQKVLNDSSSCKLLARLNDGSSTIDQNSMDEFIIDLGAAVSSITSEEDAEQVIEALVQVTNLTTFSKEHREQAEEWLNQLNKKLETLNRSGKSAFPDNERGSLLSRAAGSSHASEGETRATANNNLRRSTRSKNDSTLGDALPSSFGPDRRKNYRRCTSSLRGEGYADATQPDLGLSKKGGVNGTARNEGESASGDTAHEHFQKYEKKLISKFVKEGKQPVLCTESLDEVLTESSTDDLDEEENDDQLKARKKKRSNNKSRFEQPARQKKNKGSVKSTLRDASAHIRARDKNDSSIFRSDHYAGSVMTRSKKLISNKSPRQKPTAYKSSDSPKSGNEEGSEVGGLISHVSIKRRRLGLRSNT